MDGERWQRVERLYHATLECEPAHRAAFLAESSGGDQDLRREVEEMLALAERHESFLEQPALEIALGRDSMTTTRLRRAFEAALARKAGDSGGKFRLDPGARLGPYEVVEPAGAGGMGEIYSARDTRLGRVVALKILAGRLTDQAGIRRRFEAEAQAISSLNHPNICTLYDIGHHEGVDYLVMEYLEGQTLAKRLKQGPVPYPELLLMATEVSGALAYAHDRGVIHRDVKPANIMLTAFGVKLLDFGLARWAEEAEALSAVPLPDADSSLTVTGLILGTPQYMAPEQIERREVDARTDIFTLGAVLFEMATGRKAFEGRTSEEVMRAILAGNGPDRSSLQAAVPGGLADATVRCLKRQPDDRWQSAAELHRNLKRLARPDAVLLSPRLANAARIGAFAAALLVLCTAKGDSGSAVRRHIQFRNDTKYEVLRSFPARDSRPAGPIGLTAGPHGALYGTTANGGDAWAGIVFELDPPLTPDGQWVLRVLYPFTGGADGASPGGLIVGKDGRLYGTTAFGGASGNGTVFELTPPELPGRAWTERVLHHFTRQGGDGCDPDGTLIFGKNGELYGTTQSGGTPGQGAGIVFRLTPPAIPGGPWAETVLYTFTGPNDGANPQADLTLDKAGALYGTTNCATPGAGVVFKLEPPAMPGTEWMETVLHHFTGQHGDGACSSGGLMFGQNGALYGTTTMGEQGRGSVFELKPPATPGGPWTETVLHPFTGLNGDGSDVLGALAPGPDGALYGATRVGGQWGAGTIFELKPPAAPGGPWTETVLHTFKGPADGANPSLMPRLILEPSGKIYGVAAHGGPEGGGTVFRLTF
jgi:uncharacterized repeat protein (TIGR03803 family)